MSARSSADQQSTPKRSTEASTGSRRSVCGSSLFFEPTIAGDFNLTSAELTALRTLAGAAS